MRERIGPTPDHAERVTLFSILARNQVGRHWVYSGHDPRIFVAPKNARNAETKHRSGAGPIPLLALSASMTSTYTSLGFSQELNPQPQLLKALVYHSATSAVVQNVSDTNKERRWGPYLSCSSSVGCGLETTGRFKAVLIGMSMTWLPGRRMTTL
jgi:hypothetical protein